MSKIMTGNVQRARIAPTSRFKPKTWMGIQAVTPWVTGVVVVLTTWLSPVLALCLLFAGVTFYFFAGQWIPGPIFKRNRDEPAINLGRDEYGIPLMLPVKDLLRHTLLIGTTGCGKTTTIRTMAESVMKMGGGFCFIDGKADTLDTYAILYEIVKKTDREEDLLVLNFLNPQQSHTFNFLLYGEADFLAEIITGFMQDSQGDNAYWQGKAKILMKTILACLVYKRDNKEKFPGFGISISEIRKYFSIHSLTEMAKDENLPLYDDLSKPIKQRLINYLNELGPWQEIGGQRPSPAANEVIRQHGFYVQQWGEPFDLLSGVFGRIFDDQNPDIDINDVVINSRILVVLLPSLSYSLGTLRGLGRAVLNTFKIALSTGLGKDIDGIFKDIETKVRKNRPAIPFMLIADEYGSYAVEGFDTILAQARSLGMAVMVSVQELASLFKSSESDAKRMLGNTNIKMIMKIEDTDTAEYIAKRVGEEFFLTPGASGSGGALIDSVANWDGSYQYQKDARVSPRDLTAQKVGEGYIIYGDDMRKYYTRFIPAEGKLKEMRLMRYIEKVSVGAKQVKDKIKEMFEEAKSTADRLMVGAAESFRMFAISKGEDALYKKYIEARRSYWQNTLDASPVSVFDLHEGGYLEADGEELGDIAIIVRKRGELEDLQDGIWKKIISQNKISDDFWNEVLKPSEKANAFMRQIIGEIRKVASAADQERESERESW